MLKISNLSVNYGQIEALNGASFRVEQGEIVTIIGSNGAGKTTALNAITNVVAKRAGQVLFEDEDITDWPSYQIARSGISHVPEGRKIFPELTVEENLWVSTVYQKHLSQADIAAQEAYVFQLFPRLQERRRQGGGTLSGGEQQMLAIGRGLMAKPRLMILDEPSLGLSPLLVEEMFYLIERINEEGMTILLVEQNASVALSIADRAYVLASGAVQMEGSGTALLADERIRKAYLGA